jgi:hypothetical protein
MRCRQGLQIRFEAQTYPFIAKGDLKDFCDIPLYSLHPENEFKLFSILMQA